MTSAIIHGNILAEFENMRIEHGRLQKAYDVFDSLRVTKRKAPFQPKRWSSIFAPTGSGKSTAIRMYLENVVAKEVVRRKLFPADMDPFEIATKQKAVVHITLDGVTNIKNLMQRILSAMGGPTKGTKSDLTKLVYDHLKEPTVELLIIDELQHLLPKKDKDKRPDDAGDEPTAITDTLKSMLIHGCVPMVFVGIEEARSVIFNSKQLAGRNVQQIDYSCLDWTIPAEREIFLKYCGNVGLKLKQHELFEQSSNFLKGDIPACLHAATSGRLGMVSRIVEQASLIAVDDKSSQVLRPHLEKAVDQWAIPTNLITYNPFRGIREAKLVTK
jgi:AAA domain